MTTDSGHLLPDPTPREIVDRLRHAMKVLESDPDGPVCKRKDAAEAVAELMRLTECACDLIDAASESRACGGMKGDDLDSLAERTLANLYTAPQGPAGALVVVFSMVAEAARREERKRVVEAIRGTVHPDCVAGVGCIYCAPAKSIARLVEQLGDAP